MSNLWSDLYLGLNINAHNYMATMDFRHKFTSIEKSHSIIFVALKDEMSIRFYRNTTNLWYIVNELKSNFRSNLVSIVSEG